MTVVRHAFEFSRKKFARDVRYAFLECSTIPVICGQAAGAGVREGFDYLLARLREPMNWVVPAWASERASKRNGLV
jgi:hypothetical protein